MFVSSFGISINIMTYSTSDTSDNISMSVDKSNFTLVHFKIPGNVNPGAERKCAGSSLYILGQVFRKMLNTSASKNT